MVTTIAFPVLLYLLIAKSAKGTAYGVPFAAYYMVAMAMFGAFSGGTRLAVTPVASPVG